MNVKVVIRTNGGTLNVGSSTQIALGQIYHYGLAAKVNAYVESQCLHFYSVVGATELNAGKGVAESGSYVGVVKASSETQLKENGGVFVIPTNAQASNIDATVASSIGYTISGDTITQNPSKQSYYVVSSAADLHTFVASWNGGYYPGAANVKFSQKIDINGDDWTPLGTWQYPFYGKIDGLGSSINGLSMTEDSSGWVTSTGTSSHYTGEVAGFIAIAGTGDVEISNLTFKDATIESTTGANCGIVIGYVPAHKNYAQDGKGGAYWSETAVAGKKLVLDHFGHENITFNNVKVSGSITAKQHIGGFIGKCYSVGTTTFNNCVNEANVKALTAGGAAGFIGYTALSDGDVGNLVYSISAVLNNCSNKGEITQAGSGQAGGFIANFSITKASSGNVNITFTGENSSTGAVKSGSTTATANIGSSTIPGVYVGQATHYSGSSHVHIVGLN